MGWRLSHGAQKRQDVGWENVVVEAEEVQHPKEGKVGVELSVDEEHVLDPDVKGQPPFSSCGQIRCSLPFYL